MRFSDPQLLRRRKELKTRRRLKFWFAIARTLLLFTTACCLVWLITFPNWFIRFDSQLQIEGAQLLSSEQIISILNLSYPQSLFKLSTPELVALLEASPPILEANITRHLLPSQVKIQIQERKPVAVVVASSINSSSTEVGFLDAYGVFIPRKFYNKRYKRNTLPSLKVIGFKEFFTPHWPKIYQLISSSPVKIFSLDWQNPSNLIIKTDLGNVHLGDDISRFSQQLIVLAKMRELPDIVNPSQILYIDLTNPETPFLIDLNNKKSTALKLPS